MGAGSQRVFSISVLSSLSSRRPLCSCNSFRSVTLHLTQQWCGIEQRCLWVGDGSRLYWLSLNFRQMLCLWVWIAWFFQGSCAIPVVILASIATPPSEVEVFISVPFFQPQRILAHPKRGLCIVCPPFPGLRLLFCREDGVLCFSSQWPFCISPVPGEASCQHSWYTFLWACSEACREELAGAWIYLRSTLLGGFILSYSSALGLFKFANNVSWVLLPDVYPLHSEDTRILLEKSFLRFQASRLLCNFNFLMV